MKYLFLVVCVCGHAPVVFGQINASIIFSHNDYLQKKPFHAAYNLGAGYIEADVFAKDGKLMVAHTADEIEEKRTIDKLYLVPIREALTVTKNKARAFTFMIDLKTDGIQTLGLLVHQLERYPELTSSPYLTIAISGNVPDTSEWKNFPSYITFDGRPNRHYAAQHLKRVSFISNNFRAYSQWDGDDHLPEPDKIRLKEVIAAVHAQGKKIRFWGAPDVPNAWKTLLELDVDILGTDHIEDVAAFLKN